MDKARQELSAGASIRLTPSDQAGASKTLPQEQRGPCCWPIAFPYPHFMGMAALDVWFRLLFRPAVAIPPRYWPRLALALFFSLFMTLAMLPERILTALWLRLRKPSKSLPGPLIILGYYRSGTTLLQNLLSQDPNMYAPNPAQGFAPQGFCVTWFLLRWFVLPFLPRTRPQDNVSFGPLAPIEDDFALNSWALASTLPGRLVIPQAHRFYDRFNDLKQLTAEERQRWGRYQLAFVRKLALVAGRRRILLKTPAHTARIEDLLKLFGGPADCGGVSTSPHMPPRTTGAKFIYISRHPHQVFRSNEAMLERLVAIAGLQHPLAPEEMEEYLLKEYVATEEEYQRTRAQIPAGNLIEIRLQDLQADPLGTLRRCYQELGLPFTPEAEQGMIAYLNGNRDYKTNVHQPWTPEKQERISKALRPLVEKGGYDEPRPAAKAKVPLPAVNPAVRRRQVLGGLLLGLVTATLFTGQWLLLTTRFGGDSLGAVWVGGVMVGLSVLRGASSRGSTALGLYALGLTALALAAVVWLANVLLPEAMAKNPFPLIGACIWWVLGLGSAYRIGSQRL